MRRSVEWQGVALLAAGVVVLVLAELALYARQAVIDRDAFADRATAALASDEVRDEVVARLALREIEAVPDLAPRRPVIEAAAGAVVADAAFPARFRAGAEALHRELFAGRPAELALAGAAAALRARVQAHSPAAAALLPPADPRLLRFGGGRLEDALVASAPWGRRLAPLGPLALIAGLGLLAAGAAQAPTRRRGARRVALGIAVAGGAVVAATTIGRAVVLSTFDTSHGDAVVGTIWDAFLADLRVWGLVAGAIGVTAAAIFDPGARGAGWRAVRRALSPCGSPARIARAAALVALAALLLWMPEVPLDLALVTAAGALLFTGVAEVVRVST